jgi:hypothetical protein
MISTRAKSPKFAVGCLPLVWTCCSESYEESDKVRAIPDCPSSVDLACADQAPQTLFVVFDPSPVEVNVQSLPGILGLSIIHTPKCSEKQSPTFALTTLTQNWLAFKTESNLFLPTSNHCCDSLFVLLIEIALTIAEKTYTLFDVRALKTPRSNAHTVTSVSAISSRGSNACCRLILFTA